MSSPPVLLTQPASLRAAAQAAQRRGEPLVVMTTLAGCPYCELVRSRYLGPMQRDEGLAAVQLDVLDRQSPLQDFNGETRTPAEVVRGWNARFTPTVLFFDANGRELAERLVGVASPDFYGSYLDQRLATARQRLK